jgi:hypothetical protein
MRKKDQRKKLEGLLAEIHESTSEAGSDGEVCLSPMLGETIDSDNSTSEGDDNDELFT